MPGVKGRSGGRREGAGLKPKSLRFKLGDFVLINHQVDEKGSVEGGTITEVTRREIVITLKGKVNEIIKIIR